MRLTRLVRSLAVAGLVTVTAPAFALSPIAEQVITAIAQNMLPPMLALLQMLTAAGLSMWVAKIILRKFWPDSDTFDHIELEQELDNITAARMRAMERSNPGLSDETGGHLNDSFGEFELDESGLDALDTPVADSGEMDDYINDSFGEFELDWDGKNA